jgi:hypothetical protein
MASLIPKFVKKEIVDSWISENLYVMLLTSAHVPNAATQQNISQVNPAETVDSGGVYPAGGVPITGKTQQYNPLNPANAYLDADNTVIGPGATITFKYIIVYQNSGNSATSKIRCQIEFGANQVITNGTVLIQWNSLGIIYVQ